MKRNPYIPYFGRIVGLCQLLESNDKPMENIGDFRYQAQAILIELEGLGESRCLNVHDIALVKFSLVAYIDEYVLSHYSDIKSSWEKYTLQMEYYDSNIAGEKFFDNLQSVRLSNNTWVFEIYYLCLQFGFKGRCALSDGKELPLLMLDIKLQLSRIYNHQSKSDGNNFSEDELSVRPIKSSSMRLIGYALLGLLVSYVVILFSVNAYLQRLNEPITPFDSLGNLYSMKDGKMIWTKNRYDR